MALQKKRRNLALAAGAGVVVIAGGLGLALFSDCDICQAANQIILQGKVAQNCNISVNASAAATNLPLSATGSQRVQVGTITQSCNKKAGYDLEIRSENCSGDPSGAKLVSSDGDDRIAYTAEFSNPTTGGSQATVTGLLSQGCDSDDAREVRNAIISNEISTVFVNFTGRDNLAAGTYQDVITIEMKVK